MKTETESVQKGLYTLKKFLLLSNKVANVSNELLEILNQFMFAELFAPSINNNKITPTITNNNARKSYNNKNKNNINEFTPLLRELDMHSKLEVRIWVLVFVTDLGTRHVFFVESSFSER